MKGMPGYFRKQRRLLILMVGGEARIRAVVSVVSVASPANLRLVILKITVGIHGDE